MRTLTLPSGIIYAAKVASSTAFRSCGALRGRQLSHFTVSHPGQHFGGGVLDSGHAGSKLPYHKRKSLKIRAQKPNDGDAIV
jgi:hypothetical protein